jgi:hypothetical protein
MKPLALGFIYATAMGALFWAIEQGYAPPGSIMLGIAVGFGVVIAGVFRRGS